MVLVVVIDDEHEVLGTICVGRHIGYYFIWECRHVNTYHAVRVRLSPETHIPSEVLVYLGARTTRIALSGRVVYTLWSVIYKANVTATFGTHSIFLRLFNIGDVERAKCFVDKRGVAAWSVGKRLVCIIAWFDHVVAYVYGGPGYVLETDVSKRFVERVPCSGYLD